MSASLERNIGEVYAVSSQQQLTLLENWAENTTIPHDAMKYRLVGASARVVGSLPSFPRDSLSCRLKPLKWEEP